MCIKKCPQNALRLETELIDLEDKTVATVSEDHRKRIKYSCSACNPESGDTPCVIACETKAIKCIWNPR